MAASPRLQGRTPTETLDSSAPQLGNKANIDAQEGSDSIQAKPELPAQLFQPLSQSQSVHTHFPFRNFARFLLGKIRLRHP